MLRISWLRRPSEADDVLVLVLDNVHILSDPEVIASLDAVLRHPPPNLRVVMTRSQ